MVAKKRKVLMIRLLRLEIRQGSVHYIFTFMAGVPFISPNNRKNTPGFREFSEGVGWEQLPEMGQSLTGFMGYRNVFG